MAGPRFLPGCPFVLPLLLALVTVMPFGRTMGNGFVEWDDYVLLVDNAAYRGFGGAEVRWMFTAAPLGHYTPVSWLTLALDYRVWGMWPGGYHLTSLLLHAATAALFYGVAGRLLGRATTLVGGPRQVGAAAAALFFALHPLRVETVAWATERRGVLAGLFVVVAVGAYLAASEAAGGRRWWWLGASVGAYGLALGSKGSALMLPVVLGLLDVYPLRRLPGRGGWGGAAAWRVWGEKVPYLVVGLLFGTRLYYGVSGMVRVLDLPTWLAKGFLSLWLHVEKMVVPVGLSPLYEMPARMTLLEPRVLVAVAGVTVLSGAGLALRRVWPAGLAVWVYHGLMLAPVTGIVHAGPQVTADRYSYVGGLGWALLVGAGVGLAARAAGGRSRWRGLGRVGVAGALVGLVTLGALTWRQVGIWKDGERLWSHAVAVAPECAICQVNLGNWLHEHGASAAAIEHYRLALSLRPERVGLHANVGLALARLGRFPEAAREYELLLAHSPWAIGVRQQRAVALTRMGKAREAVEELRRIVRALGPEPALAHFEKASPEDAVARAGRLLAYSALGRPGPASEERERLRALSPDLAAVLAGE